MKKRVQFCIEEDQEKRLLDLEGKVPGARTVSDMVRMAVDRWLEIEGTVYEAHYKEVRLKLVSSRERQPVITDIAAVR